MTTSQTAAPATPKFAITGNTVEEISKAFAEFIAKTQPIEIVDAKRGNGQYGSWELGGGDGITLQDKELALKAGIPLYLGITVVFRKLTAPDKYEAEKAAVVVKQAATITKLEQRIAALKAKS